MQDNVALTGESEAASSDLGPLAWVLDELRKSLDGATKALRRFVRDAELARGSDLAALDASQLRIARQQLHQAVGALEMVGMAAPAKMLRAMEALAQRFVQRPETCSDAAANKVERASFALTEYLEGILKGKTASPVALFPQYRDVLELIGEERVHPADLWLHEWRWIDVEMPRTVKPWAYDSSVRARLDDYVLKVVKTGDRAAARAMRNISLGFAASQSALEPRVFWKICAAYFEAVSCQLCPTDVYGKRAASRILLQYRTLAKGLPDLSERLLQDLLFFCAQAVPQRAADAPVLAAVRAGYGLTQARSFNYDTPQFGRFDPALLAQARKRIAAATETWSALAGGDIHRLKAATDQFSLVTDSIVKLHPDSAALARALTQAVATTTRSGEAPPPALAMEVATSVLYLEAAYEDMDPTDSHMAERSNSLAERLMHVTAGGQPEPLEAWMEDLYRRVSDRQTMGSVVDELRTSLGDIERALDTYFRQPDNLLPLHEVPSQLAQMRGVFSVLGLDQAALASLRMRTSVERFLSDDPEQASDRAATVERLGNSLGALGFLIDMLSYQRELAKKLFVYDEEVGEFKPVMGREKAPLEMFAAADPVQPEAIHPVHEAVVAPSDVTDADTAVQALAVSEPAVSGETATPPVAPPAAALASALDEDDEEIDLREIFLEEAREVVQTGLQAIRSLAADPADLTQQTTLRRAFHTLKGSSRMVGLQEFGEAAWAMEQLLNSWLADQKPASDELIALSEKAMHGLGRWVEDIADGHDELWEALVFRRAADALRLDARVLDLHLPGDELLGVAEVTELSGLPADGHEAEAEAAAEALSQQDFASTELANFGDLGQTPDDEVTVVSELDSFSAMTDDEESLHLDDIDFGNDFDELEATSVALIPADQAVTQMADLPEAMDATLAMTPEADAEMSLEGDLVQEEQIKVIGALRIEIPLYNVYLNEADEWSRRLLNELSEWSLELHESLPESAVALAHSLAGSSATVGFGALSEIARALEYALAHVQLHGQGLAAHAQVFVESAEDIRRLLHQFAAGFLKTPNPTLVEALKVILDVEFPVAPDASNDAYAPEQDDDEVDFDALDGQPESPELSLESDVEPEPEFEAEPEAEAEAEFEAEPEAEAEAELEAEPESEFEPEAAEPASEPELTPPPDGAEVADEFALSAQPVLDAVEVKVEPMLTPAWVDRRHDTSARGDDGDDIESRDVLDVDLFPIFEEEALELLPQLGGTLRQWVARPENLLARQELLRVLHTLKGSARLAGAMYLGEMAHRMESAVEYLGVESLQAADLEPLMGRFDALQRHFEVLCATPEQDLVLPEVAMFPVVESVPMAEIDALDAAHDAASDEGAGLSSDELAANRLNAVTAMAPVTTPRITSNQTVRVRSQLLDRLVNQAGEVMITRSRLEVRLNQLRGSLGDLTGNLDRLRHQLRDIELQSESQMQSRLAQAKDSAQGFDPLEFDRFTRVQELTRMMAESVDDVATVQRNLQRTVEGTEDDLIAQGRQARELQRDLLRTRMVEFDSISERLYGVVRQASKEAGKQVRLDIKGILEIDRGVLERMSPAFEHLLRNAVVHGIEGADIRLAAGKPAAGTITIALQQQSNDVTVEFSDDGGGLDLARIRQKARLQGHGDAVLSEQQAADLIFTPGFSTAAQVTELAGRGIGLDVVRAEVSALGGRIETSTEPGCGTRFKLVLPLTTAVTQVVMLRLGEQVFGVPANLIEMVRRVPAADLERAYESNTVAFGDESLPFYWCGALLQVSANSQEPRSKTLPIVIFRSAGQRVALHVDEVLGNQEVVVKHLGPQLSRLAGLTGMSVLASGAVVLIYNPVALSSVYGEQARQLRQPVDVGQTSTPGGEMPATLLAAAHQLPLVLVVDDSITVRRVTQRLLKREGFRVALASDGLQALERLQEEKPAVVLSDIEMPRMDGFDLVRNIRGDQRLRDLPIIMITSRIAEKHRELARELGVDHYLGKPYSEDELVDLVRQYCLGEVSAEKTL